jgi:glycosyltransferase involved in cell wall biosynthesis
VFAGLVQAIGTVYGAIDALVLLSDTETTSRVVIEAMACGVPVLASAVGGVPELLDHGRAGHLVPAGDGEAALAALRQLAADPALYVEPARKRAETGYLVSIMGRRVTEFYRDLRTGAPSGLWRRGHRSWRLIR